MYVYCVHIQYYVDYYCKLLSVHLLFTCCCFLRLEDVGITAVVTLKSSQCHIFTTLLHSVLCCTLLFCLQIKNK